MVIPDNLLPEKELHTDAKHKIFRSYLDAWLPIMSSTNRRVLYIDGFAGPGRYRDGDDGSPIIALKSALERPRPITSEVDFIFIEAEPNNARYLEQLVLGMELPPNFKWRVVPSKFDETLAELITYMDAQRATLVPWKQCIGLSNPDERKECLHDTYL